MMGPTLPEYTRIWKVTEGMTLRDWFAGMALAGIASLDVWVKDQGETEHDAGVIGAICYRLADAMLKEREK